MPSKNERTSQYTQIDDIDIDAVTGGATFNRGFARGVGFTSTSEGGQST